MPGAVADTRPRERLRATPAQRLRRRPAALGRNAAAVAVAGALAAAVATIALAPAASLADDYLGSKLDQPATVTQMFQTDTTFWQTALTSATGPALAARVPESGQILQFHLRGYAAGNHGAQPIHFQVLRPQPNGTLKIIATSQPFVLPAQDGVWPYNPINFCVKAGDYLGFSTEGGFNPQSAPMGVPFQVFAPTSGSATAYFTKNEGVMNGAVLTPTMLSNSELLMSAYEGTGGNASPLCGGIRGIQLVALSQTDKVASSGATTVRVACRGPLACIGTLTLTTPASGEAPASSAASAAAAAATTLASAHFKIQSHQTANVPVTVSAQGRSLLTSGHGQLLLRLSLIAGDGGPNNTTSGVITLTS